MPMHHDGSFTIYTVLVPFLFFKNVKSPKLAYNRSPITDSRAPSLSPGKW